MEEEIEILENYIREWHDTDVAQALENLITRYKELEEKNKTQLEAFELEKESSRKRIEYDYIAKSKVKENIQDLESRGYFEEANAMKDLLERSGEDANIYKKT